MTSAVACVIASLLAAPTSTTSAEIDPALRSAMNTAPADGEVTALVFLRQQVDGAALRDELDTEHARRSERIARVVRSLQRTALESQVGMRQLLDALQANGSVRSHQPLWIANAIQVTATPAALAEIASHADAEHLYIDPPIEGMNPVATGLVDAGGGGVASALPTTGLLAMQAPAAWALGYTGAGRLIASLDSGVDGNHPALAARWRGLDPSYAGNPDWAWFDPVTQTTFPADFIGTSHGTHTMGSATGGAPGDPIGVAPGAEWIHAAVIDRVSTQQTVTDAMLAYQWVIDPDGNPDTSFDVPDVCFNSWGIPQGFGYPPCDETFWSFLDNLDAAGIIVIFAAGNEGAAGLRRPADRATSDFRTVAVGAIDPATVGWPVPAFSSVGPTACTPWGLPAIKPNLAAPGVAVRSSISGGDYIEYSGTSMATPHVAGVAALVRQACPDLSPEVVMQLIYDTALDVGAIGNDNSTGRGVPNALAAVVAAELLCTFGISVPGGAPPFVSPGVPMTVHAEIIQNGEQLVPGSARVWYRFQPGAPFQSKPLVAVGGDLFAATLPAPPCGSQPEYYMSALGSKGTLRTSPSDAPLTTYKTIVGEAVTIPVYTVDFANGLAPGWWMTGLWNITNSCAPAVDTCSGAPASSYAYYGAPATCDYDGIAVGTLGSPSIALPLLGKMGTLEARICYHQNVLFAGLMGGGTFVMGGVSVPLPNTTGWMERTVDLSSLAGQTLPLKVNFFNNLEFVFYYTGLMVRSVTIELTTLSCDTTPPVLGDLDGNGIVNGLDLAIVLGAWGTPDADLSGDGTTGGADITIILGNWS